MFAATTRAHKACGGRRLGLILCLLCVAPSWSLAAENSAEGSAPLPATTATLEITAAPKIITRIEFAGNRVTQPRILHQEMVIKEGDIADPVKIERSRQLIMDLGLFKSVRVIQEPLDDGVLVRFLIKEKYYILPTPKLNRDDENHFTLGAEIKLDNVAGLNQQLKLKYETDDAKTSFPDQKIDTYSFSYNYPRMFGSPWSLSTELEQINSPVEVVAGQPLNSTISLYKKMGRSGSVQALRWLDPLTPSRGWQLGGGLVSRHNSYNFVNVKSNPNPNPVPNPVPDDALVIGVSLLGQYTNVRDYLYSRSGKEYGYKGEIGSRTLGSDSRYTRHELFFRKFSLLAGRPHENIDFQARLGLSSGDMFPGETTSYSLGGVRSLRGHDSGSITGDAFAVLNVEYLRPLFGYYPLRGVLFYDIGNAYEKNTKIDLGSVKWDVGVGLRYRLKSFVKIDLRVDAAYVYGYGDQPSRWKYTFGTREVF